MLAPSAGVKSGGVDEDELGILLGRDGEFGFVDGGDAVADRNPLPVDEDHALGGGEIGVPEPGRRVGEGGSGKQCRAQDPGVGADRQRLGVLRVSACERRSGVRPDLLSGICGCPSGASAALAGKQPDLEQLEGVFARDCARNG